MNIPPQKRVDKQVMPNSELELNNKTLEPGWGKNEINDDLYAKFTKKYFQFDEKGNIVLDTKGEPILSEEGIWGQLGILTRDVRSSNLQEGNAWAGKIDEIAYCEERLQLAADTLLEGYEECAMLLLGRAAIRLELGLSRGGFLRKRLGTFTQEHIGNPNDVPKTMFGNPSRKGN